MCDLSNPIFHDEDKAREWLEARIWPDGPVCPHCGTVDQATLMQGESHRPVPIPAHPATYSGNIRPLIPEYPAT
jgi:hypothetical protein